MSVLYSAVRLTGKDMAIVIFCNALLSFCQSAGTFTDKSAVLGSAQAAGHQVMTFIVIVYL